MVTANSDSVGSTPRLWVRFKRGRPVLIASRTIRANSLGDMDEPLRDLRKACGPAVAGDPMAIYRFGGRGDGEDVELAYPVRGADGLSGKATVRTLEPAEVLAVVHRATPGETRAATKLIDLFCDNHGLAWGMGMRRVFQEYRPGELEGSLVETQAVLHEWPSLLYQNVARVLDAGTARQVVRGVRCLRPTAASLDRVLWVKAALERLGAQASEEERRDILSGCAHFFPAWRIAALREVYEATGDVDRVLEVMREDPQNYFSRPERQGRMIVVEKQPADPEAYSAAATREERAKAFCHCSIVRQNLDIAPAEFCHCSAGWFRQIWEGVLGRPVKVEATETLVGGGDTCRFAIHL